MAPKSPWKKVAAQGKEQDAHPPSPRQPAAPSGPAGSHIDYAQVQAEETEVLQAIYMDDYHEVDVKGAWTTTSEKAFTLKLKASSDESVFVVLSVKLTATYPKSLPLISVQESQAPADAIDQVRAMLTSKPKELVGEVMIHEIASTILDILEDSVLRRDDRHQRSAMVPSLEEERVFKEAEALRMAQEQEAELLRTQEAAKAEEERGLEEMVSREIVRRQEAKSRREKSSAAFNPIGPVSRTQERHDMIDFQREIVLQPEGAGSDIEFSAVDRIVNIRKGPLTNVSTAQPTTVTSEASIRTTFVLKKVTFAAASSNRAKLALYALENELDMIKRLRQESAINVLDFLVDTEDTLSITVLVEYANKGSLQEMLEMVASVPIGNVRTWTLQLLESLDYFHRNGIIHGRVHANNVLLSRSLATGATAMKLSDAGFQQHLHDLAALTSDTKLNAWTPTWFPPEVDEKKSRKTDVWEAGVVFVQMLFGLDVTQKYVTPQTMINALDLSEPLEELLQRFFNSDARRRPAAFDLMPSEFLRSNVPVLEEGLEHRSSSTMSMPQALNRSNRPRRGSTLGFGATLSRYENEWVEQGRLGKGGYGEVVKARNKLDARIYAIKKVVSKSSSELSSLLSEVMLLSRLNHPYVVRYYTAWPEEQIEYEAMASEDDTTVTTATATEEEPSFSMRPTLDFGPSSRGLDFVSSSGFKIQFGNDSDESDDDDSQAVESDNDSTGTQQDQSAPGQGKDLGLRRTTSSARSSRPIKTTLFIQMEFCERHTLRDLILRELYYSPEEGWKLFRQVLEGLVHIHGHGIIHRDLKPDNIFMDVASNPRIGDFGLATSGQYQLADRTSNSTTTAGDMTRSVGTTLYVAPELRSEAHGTYDAKVDMYSLGIIFFEMCFPLKTAMERDKVLRSIREKEHTLPQEFEMPEKAQQGEIIMSLISHRPSERPSSVELLRSGKVPLQIEDDTIKEALRGLSDASSPYYQKMMSALFAHSADNHVKDFAWDMKSASVHSRPTDTAPVVRELMRIEVKDRLSSIFRRHGAVEARRPALFPLSDHYSNSTAVKLLDASGLLVQLPYDLTLPFARQVAREPHAPERTFVFGHVFRDTYTGGAPQINGEADFDIVSQGRLDLALKEAEVIKVIDEIIGDLPSLTASQMCFHINHSDISEAILEHCRVPKPVRPSVMEVLSKLNIHENTWQKIRTELRAPTLGIPSTSLDTLAKFDFRDTPEKAFLKLTSMMEGSALSKKLQDSLSHLRKLVSYLKLLEIRCKIYVCPLSCFNQKFYVGGMLFQCLFDTKKKTVLAAGGRYDSLIREYRPGASGTASVMPHAVGANIGWDRLVLSMERYHGKDAKRNSRKVHPKSGDEAPDLATRRCDVLVSSFDPETLRSTGLKILTDLWKHGISAELATDARSAEELQARYDNEDRHSWLVIVKHDAGGGSKPDLKVRSLDVNEETDVPASNLVAHLRAELRERDQRGRARLLRHHSSQFDSSIPTVAQGKATHNVHVLISQHRSKKSNKWGVIEAAQTRARELLASYSTAPILAVETRDETLEKIRSTRLGDSDSWRKLIQSAPLNERQYLSQMMDELEGWSTAWKASQNDEQAIDEGQSGKSRTAFVYNFRSGACIMYDLGV